MNWFLEIDGIGIKTAVCILAFNYKFQLCAVDTHVWEMSKALGWCPPDCTNEIALCMLLDHCLPEHIKYDLHQMFWHHRQLCKACKGRYTDGVKAEDEAACPLRDRMTRSPVKKRSPRKASTDESGEEEVKPVAKRLRLTAPFEDYTAEKAAELGYREVVVRMSDDFAAGSTNVSVKKKWVLIQSE